VKESESDIFCRSRRPAPGCQKEGKGKKKKGEEKKEKKKRKKEKKEKIPLPLVPSKSTYITEEKKARSVFLAKVVNIPAIKREGCTPVPSGAEKTKISVLSRAVVPWP